MARPFIIEIVESEEFLEKSLRQAKSAGQAERLRMLWWLKTGKVKAHQELSSLLAEKGVQRITKACLVAQIQP